MQILFITDLCNTESDGINLFQNKMTYKEVGGGITEYTILGY